MIILPIDDVWLSGESVTSVAGRPPSITPSSLIPPQASHNGTASTSPGAWAPPAPEEPVAPGGPDEATPTLSVTTHNGAPDDLTSIRDDSSNGAHMTSTNGSDHTNNGWSAEPRRFDPTAFDPGPDLPPLPTLRPLPAILPLNRWVAAPLVPPSPAAAPPAVPVAPPEMAGPGTPGPDTADTADTAETGVPASDDASAAATEEPGSPELPGPADVRPADVDPADVDPADDDAPGLSAGTSDPQAQVSSEAPVRHRRRSPDTGPDTTADTTGAQSGTQHAHLHEAMPAPTPAHRPGDPDPAPHASGAVEQRSPGGAVPSHTRRVLVLGGSGTVGSAIVRALAAQGARVAVHHASRAAETDELVRTLPGEGHLSVSADLADADAVGELVRSVDTGFDGLDVVINAASAGDAVRHTSVVDSSLSEWTDAWTGTLTVDVLGAATTAHAAAAAFIARGQGGRIILLAARGRPFAGGRGSVTVATEQAVAALGSALALELAPYGVGVMVVGSGSAAASGWSPEDLAETVAWLATGPASALAGATFNIAG